MIKDEALSGYLLREFGQDVLFMIHVPAEGIELASALVRGMVKPGGTHHLSSP